MRFFLFIAVVALTGCEGVPDLTFVGADGSVDASAESGNDAASDVQAIDSAADAADTSDSCALVPGATTCCGTIPCGGQCDIVNCARCETAMCPSGTFCCGRPNNAQCVSIGQTCH